MKKKLASLLTLAIALSALCAPRAAQSAEFIVYSVYKALDMGNPGEVPQKDYYLNMGTANGLSEGSSVDVLRKVSTYDTLSEKLYREILFKIATLKVIHVEANAAVARLEKAHPADKIPVTQIKGVMIGDLVRPSSK